MGRIYWLVVLVAVLGYVLAADKPEETKPEVVEDSKDVDRNTAVSAARLTLGDVGLPSNLLSLLANGGAVAAGVLAVGAIMMLAMPMFGLRMCSLFNNCDHGYYQGYSASGAGSGPNSVYNDAYSGGSGAYPQQPGYPATTYQKRSLEYIGPILKALSSAYDKYGKPVNPAPAKKA